MSGKNKAKLKEKAEHSLYQSGYIERVSGWASNAVMEDIERSIEIWKRGYLEAIREVLKETQTIAYGEGDPDIVFVKDIKKLIGK